VPSCWPCNCAKSQVEAEYVYAKCRKIAVRHALNARPLDSF
jgi:hypothetical protein